MTIHVTSQIIIKEAETQTDYLISYESMYGDCDAALDNDGDFIVSAGKDLLLINNFDFIHRVKIKDKGKASCYHLHIILYLRSYGVVC